MKRRASFRSQLLVGSVLWTLGVFVVISAALIHFLGTTPRPHRFIYINFGSHIVLAVIVGALSLAGGAWQIRRIAAALGLLHRNLTSVLRGEALQVRGDYPAEVQ